MAPNRHILQIAACLILSIAPISFAQISSHSQKLAFTHVAVIDATGAPTKLDMTVVIDSDRIARIEKTRNAKLSTDVRVIDATGKFLIPGLWDMHVHEWSKEVFFPLLLANGITGVRDMGSPLDQIKQWRAEMASGTLLGPNIFAAGLIVDGPRPGCGPCSIAVGTPDEGRKAVQTVKQQGSDFVKVYTMLPRDAYFAIADEAKLQHMVFAGHVPESISAAEASDAGQKSIEHLMDILVSCSSKEKELRRENEARLKKDGLRAMTSTLEQAAALDSFDQKHASVLFAKFIKNSTWMCPTLSVLRVEALIGDPSFTNDDRVKYIPPFIKQFWDDPYSVKGRTAEENEIAKRVYKAQLELVGRMRRAGVQFIAGTDSPNPYVFPGFSLHEELALLVQAGFTPMEALQSATRNAATYLGLGRWEGTIETDKHADLVLLDADPLENISNTRKISAVILNGKLITKPELEKMLADAELAANGAH
jgi:hypothetical protein